MFEELIEYLEQREDAELQSDDDSYTPNEEMRLLIQLKQHGKHYEALRDVLKLCEAHMSKTHHLDGCQWSRTSYKICDCGRNELLELVKQLNEFTGI